MNVNSNASLSFYIYTNACCCCWRSSYFVAYRCLLLPTFICNHNSDWPPMYSGLIYYVYTYVYMFKIGSCFLFYQSFGVCTFFCYLVLRTLNVSSRLLSTLDALYFQELSLNSLELTVSLPRLRLPLALCVCVRARACVCARLISAFVCFFWLTIVCVELVGIGCSRRCHVSAVLLLAMARKTYFSK